MADVNPALSLGLGEQMLTGPRSFPAFASVSRKSIARTTSERLTQLKPCFPLPITPLYDRIAYDRDRIIWIPSAKT